MAPLLHGDDDWHDDQSYNHADNQPSSNGPTLSLDEDKLEPIAIIGHCFRFPGDAVNDEGFWKMMMEKRCAMTEAPADRMSVSGWHHPDKRRRGQYTPKGGHFLKEDVSLFDAGFFSLSADEAAALDPQQRQLLEVTYGALENAGIPMEKAIGSETSVHVGCFGSDYRLMACKDVEMTADYDVVGVNMCMNANRISWFFDFHGTSMNIDTACSSSLVAMDLACQCLQRGEVEMGIVAGTNLILSPDMMQVFSNVNMLSPDSKSYSFDHRANGYGRGEGTGTIVIKRLTDAIQDGDTIRAVIRATGSNQDGLTPSGIMQPSGLAQANLIKSTYKRAGLSMEPTRFFEAHGTGTPVGDPIECNAIGEAFGRARSTNDPLIVGAVKSNIGHLEGASGIAAVIKAILVLESGIIPPNANFEKLNPKIDLEFLKMKLPLEAMQWPTRGLRRASINSFGFGGSNAHVVLDDAFHFLRDHGLVGNHVTVESPAIAKTSIPPLMSVPEPSSSPKLLMISSASKTGVKDVALAYKSYFEQLITPKEKFTEYMADLAHTLNTRRSALSNKSFIVASSLSDLRNIDNMTSPVYQAHEKPALGFVFTGQGSQWAGMGRELFQYPVFRNTIEQCESALRYFGCLWSLRGEMLNDGKESRINNPEIAQPANTALQIALVDLLHSIGLQPAAVIGHSSGEIGAAYALGALSIKEAMQIAYFRGVCAGELARIGEQHGAMVAVGLSEEQTQVYIDQIADACNHRGTAVACINSQKSVTVSGDADQVEMLRALLEADNIFARKLKIPVAYHSSHMNQVASSYQKSMAGVGSRSTNKCTTAIISSVTGQKVSAAELQSPEYWVANLVSPVQFTKAFLHICTESGRKIRKKLDGSHRHQLGVNILLEIGPHSTLQGPIRDMLSTLPWGADVSYFPTIRRKENAIHEFLNAIGSIHCLGISVDMNRVNRLADPAAKHRRVLVDLPEYPFNHSTSYWRESRLSKRSRFARQGRIDLLGKPVADWNSLEPIWRHNIRLSEMPWVEDHIINGALIYPGAGMLVMAIEAANQTVDPNENVAGFQLKDVKFQRALTIPRTAEGIETNLLLRRNNLPWMEFRLFSFEDDDWHENCHGYIKVDYESVNEVADQEQDLNIWLQQDSKIVLSCTTQLDHERVYSRLHSSGFEFGPAFQTVLGGRCNKTEATASIKVFQWDSSQYPQPHVIHPATLDGILHLSSAALAGGDSAVPTAIPTGIKSLWVAKEGASGESVKAIRASTSMKTMHKRGHEFDMGATDEGQTSLLVTVQGLQSTIVANSRSDSRDEESQLTVYHMNRVPELDLLSSEQVAKYCSQALPTDSEAVAFFRDLNFVLYKFLDDAVKALREDTSDYSHVLPHIRRYTEWARLQRTKYHSGELELSRPEWRTQLQDEAYFEAACHRISANEAGAAYVHTGRNLVSILRGEQEPLKFLFTGDMMAKWYAEVNNRPVCFDTWGLYLRTMARKNPTMRILEIGAGTGGSTGHILRALSTDSGLDESNPLYMSYDYTDISPAFFEKAAERYAAFPRIRFQTLDIKDNPSIQGFDLESYDLIVAANVLHATPNIHKTMMNVRKLLKPRGKLMLYEVTRPDIIRAGFIAGLMEGWWAGIDDGRPWSPALTTTQWDGVLKTAGFTAVDVAFPEFLHSECQEMNILVASALGANDAVKPAPSFYFVIDPTSALQISAVEKLQNRYSGTVQSGSLEECASLPELSQTTLVFLVETEKPLLSDMSSETFNSLQKVINNTNSILWVTAGGGHVSKKPEYGIVDGLTRTLRNEKANRRICTLALDMDDEMEDRQLDHIVNVINNVLLHQAEPYEPEFVEIDGMLHVLRVEPQQQLSSEVHNASLPQQSAIRPLSEVGAVQLSFSTSGLLSSLHWTDDIPQPLSDDEAEIETKAIAVSFKDVLTVLGKSPERPLGQASAGIVIKAGRKSEFHPRDRVVSFGPGQFKTRGRSRQDFMLRLPDEVSFLDAACIPVFGTAWHILVEIGRLRAGKSVLIHSGAGSTGQAAIQIAQHLGAEIYTTVSSQQKKRFLIDTYGIPSDRIFYSRDTSFAGGVMRATKGRGVDVVVNTLGGEVQQASWECVASYGQLIHFGHQESKNIAHSNRQASFTYFDSVVWMQDRPDMALEAIQTVLRLVADGHLDIRKVRNVRNASSIEDVFRSMQDGTTTGTTVIDMTAEASVPTLLTTKISPLDSDATYVIAGGLGGLGRATARWMAARGARNLALLGRAGAKSAAPRTLIEELSNQGVRVLAPPCDVIDGLSVKKAMQEISQTMPPIKGCVQGSMVLRDSLFSKMSYEDWRTAVECKALGTRNLAVNLPQNLDFFIMLSSASNVIGLTGQSNYAAGNSYMDSFARHQVMHGRKAISLDLGPMVDDGILAETSGFLDKVLSYSSMAPVTRDKFFGLLAHCINADKPRNPDSAQIVFGISSAGGRHMENTLVEKQVFSRLKLETISSDSESKGAGQVDFKKLFLQSTSLQEGRDIVTQALIDKMVHSYRLIPKDAEVDVHAPLHTYRVDSLLAVELCNWIGKEFAADLAVLEVMGGATLAMVVNMVAARSQLKHTEWN
ncbi:hypothetical protein MW887_003150 [Aspergillus wentii]|nr:hypothetical protein MW887_003150 [Aspergillus wentii]